MEILGAYVPEAWLDALSDIHRFAPEAVLAGGCLRDLVLGGEVKDLDIFMPVPGCCDEEVRLMAGLNALGWVFLPGLSVPAEYTGAMTGGVMEVQGWHVPGLGVDVQMIFLKRDPAGWFDALRVLSRMDYGACQVGISAETGGRVLPFYTDAAFFDLTNRRITLLPPANDTQAARSVRRGLRFAEKYRGTDVVVDMSAADGFPAGCSDLAAA